MAEDTVGSSVGATKGRPDAQAGGQANGQSSGQSSGWQTSSTTDERGRASPGLDSASTVGLAIGTPRAIDPAFAGVPAGELLPLGATIERWRVVAGDGLGREFERHRGPSSEPGAVVSDRWGDEQTYELAPAAEAPAQSGGLAGGIVMPITIAHGDRAVTLFDPPLALAPAVLRFGAPLRSEARMKVVDEGDRSKLQHSGRAERTLTLVDKVAIETPMGSFEAFRIRIDFRATLQLATASEVATQYVVPGLGVVAEERIERVNAIGFINRTTKRTIVRIK